MGVGGQMTRDEYFAQDIIERLKYASEVLNPDIVCFEDDDIGVHISDVIGDAIVCIKRLRGAK
jgi:hypothetical protein